MSEVTETTKGRSVWPWLMVVAIGAVAAFVILLMTSALPANAAGSDDPTPYSVTPEGILLPDGVTFPDNGHVNIHTSQGDRGVHFESKCITRNDAECAGEAHDQAQYIGKSFIPWSAFGLSGDFCVTWVQVSMYNEHYGDGGQPPVCTTPPQPSPSPTPTKTPSPEPTHSPSPSPTTTPSPEPSHTPKPSPTPTHTVTPTPEPTETPKPTPEPTKTPSPEPTHTPKPEPTTSPSPEPTKSPSPEPSHTAGPSPEPSSSPSISAAPPIGPKPPSQGGGLAVTGTQVQVATVLGGFALITAGAFAIWFMRRRRANTSE